MKDTLKNNYRVYFSLAINKAGTLDRLLSEYPVVILNDVETLIPLSHITGETVSCIREQLHKHVDDLCDTFIVRGVFGNE